MALVLATVYVLPGYAALHVLWLAAGLVGLAVEKYDLRAGTKQGKSGKAGRGGGVIEWRRATLGRWSGATRARTRC